MAEDVTSPAVATASSVPATVQTFADRAPRRTWRTPDGLIGEGPGYKVRFADGAFTYVPNAGDRLDDAWTYRFSGATVGGRTIADAAGGPHAIPTGEGTSVVEYARGPISERYSLRADGVEQVFLIHQRLGPGDLVLTGAVGGTGWRAPDGDARGGVTFDRAGGTPVHYGAVTVVDADHQAISAPVTIDGAWLRIRVDGAWLATARYPVAVDPIITRPMVLQGNEEKSARVPSIAYDSKRNRYLVVFERAEGLAATPRDIVVLGVNAAGRQRQAELVLHGGTVDDFDPDVAYHPLNDLYLVVWARPSSHAIMGVRLTAGTVAPASSPVIVQAHPFVPPRNPIVSAATSGSGHSPRWLVVAETELDSGMVTYGIMTAQLVSSTGLVGGPINLWAVPRQEDVNGDIAFNPRTGQFLVVFESIDFGDVDRVIRGVTVNPADGARAELPAVISETGSARAPTVAYNLPMDQFWVAWTNDTPAFAIKVLTGAGAVLSGELELNGNVADADLARGTAGEVVAQVSLKLDSDPPGDTDSDIAGIFFQYSVPSGSFAVESGAGTTPTHDDRASRTAYNPYYGSYASVRDHWSVPEVEHDVQGTLLSGAYYPVWSAGGRFDADALTDRTIVRINPTSEQMTWYVDRSAGGAPLVVNWGTAGDVPVAGHYAGDARTDYAVWRPSTGSWWILPTDGTPSYAVNWGGGQYGDQPVPADYTGDGKAEIAVFRPGAAATWFVTGSTGGGLVSSTTWGTWGDIPVPGDYDGDGVDDIAVWRPSTGVWWIRYSTGGIGSIAWGAPSDQPVVGDFDGDTIDDLAVYRTTGGTGTWWVRQSSGGSTNTVWGVIGDLALPGDFNGDGRTDLTVWRPGAVSTFFSKYYGVAGSLVTNWGTAFDLPVAK
jgi:hypothetical protein